jgi:hypothetical protein
VRVTLVRATCATCPGTKIRRWLGIWAARSRARPSDHAARAAAVCGSATSSRVVPLDQSSSCQIPYGCFQAMATDLPGRRIPGRSTPADRLARRVAERNHAANSSAPTRGRTRPPDERTVLRGIRPSRGRTAPSVADPWVADVSRRRRGRAVVGSGLRSSKFPLEPVDLHVGGPQASRQVCYLCRAAGQFGCIPVADEACDVGVVDARCWAGIDVGVARVLTTRARISGFRYRKSRLTPASSATARKVTAPLLVRRRFNAWRSASSPRQPRGGRSCRGNRVVLGRRPVEGRQRQGLGRHPPLPDRGHARRGRRVLVVPHGARWASPVRRLLRCVCRVRHTRGHACTGP